ncbi:MAG TPA: class I SAM-dependent methyltransferase [Polyangiaceae bacterium]
MAASAAREKEPMMQAVTNAFDPEKYKRTTYTQWEEAAEAWHRWGPTIRAWLGPATERLLDLAKVAPGSRVLDVAAGAGDQTLDIAARVGAAGRVVATDISPAILAYAAAEAKARGMTQVSTRVMDGENLELEGQTFDVVVSRVGLIYFPDQLKALKGMHRCLVPGGRVAAIVYGPAEDNGFFSVPVSIIRRRAALGPPLPGQPGPFSLSSRDAVTRLYEAAGFGDVRFERVKAPLRLPSAGDCLAFERESFGALHQMLSGLDTAGRAAAWDEVAEALQKFEGKDGFEGPCEMVLAIGTKPQ